MLLFFGTQYFTNQNNERQQQIAEKNKIEQEKIAEQRQKDDLLKTYINDMKGFLLDEKHSLKKSKENDEIRSIARTITLTTLTQLNTNQDEQRSKEGKYNQRKGLIMQFLFESGLIKNDPKVASIIPLHTADLRFANLESANLESANLNRANLKSANLESVGLFNANLNMARLNGADLNRARLNGADLNRARLNGADLNRASLNGTNLDNASLNSTNLNGTNLNGVLNLTNTQIKSSCYWENAVYTKARFRIEARFGADLDKLVWIAIDKTANQKKIDEIKQDKASDPKTPPDCSMWK